MRSLILGLALSALAFGSVSMGRAQESAGRGIAIGQTAPDFELPGAVRYGLLENPVRLSDFRGKTVVLAFFYRARTPG